MRILPIVLLLFAALGCGSGTQPAESGGNQNQQQKDATSRKQAASVAVTPPDAATVRKHMTPDQLALGDPVVNSVGMLLVPIPAGEFRMGSPDSQIAGRSQEKPQHLVRITRPFYLSVFEVTRQQYEKVTGVRPWQGRSSVEDGPDYAAMWVSWDDAVEFCRKLSEQEGVEYRLPTEAEWEYACRAGTTTAYSFGNDVSELGQHAWYGRNTRAVGEQYAHRVGQKRPNSWGMYDMHGNVWEWCQDWHGPYGNEADVSDPSGPAAGRGRVFRGGSFVESAMGTRSATRRGIYPDTHNTYLGFRVARTRP